MLIERNTSDQILITLPSSVDSYSLQRLIEYAKYLEATATSKVKQKDIDSLADELNANWWAKNKKKIKKGA